MLNNQVRIISGTLRGRKIQFPSTLNLRPTPDRVRETLFNWLNPVIRNATCLDLFAGSGALSIEALSRGAKKVIAIEYNREAMQSLQHYKQEWNLEGLTLIQTDSREFLKTEKQKNPKLKPDIIFLDPPYKTELLRECIELLDQYQWINSNTIVYYETNSNMALPDHWETIREKKAGHVYFCLAIKRKKTIEGSTKRIV